MNKLIQIIFLPVILASCTNSGSRNTNVPISNITDSLVYTYKTIHAGSTINKSNSDSSYALFEYPVFEDDSLELNSYINELISYSDWEETKSDNVQDLANVFIKKYEQSVKEFPQHTHTWFMRSKLTVVNNENGFISFQHEGSSYTGGAHGSYYLLFHNYNTISQKEIKLNDIIDSDNRNELTRIAEKLFRKMEGIDEDFNLSDAYFFESGKFYLNENFLILPDRLRFVYNVYEIKPYSEGITRLDIPYAEISDLLNKTTIPLTIH